MADVKRTDSFVVTEFVGRSHELESIIKRLSGGSVVDVAKSSKFSHELKNFQSFECSEIIEHFHSSLVHGLSDEEATSRIEKFGSNIIVAAKGVPMWLKFFFAFVSGFSPLLWISCFFVFLAWRPFGSPPSNVYNLSLAIVLLIVISISSIFHFYQEYSTSQVLAGFKSLLPPHCLVIRGSLTRELPPSELVIGDIVLLQTGMKVPADMRILISTDLRMDKSLLTGENQPIKLTEGASQTSNMLHSKNIAFMGCNIVEGEGAGIVIATGKHNQLSKIVSQVSGVQSKSSTLQTDINRFVIVIVFLSMSTVVVVVLQWTLYLRINHPQFLTLSGMMANAIGVLVAFVPEGLPLALSMGLTIIATRLCAVHAVLVRQLPTIETLGCTSLLATDKTGTLTENKMTVRTLTTIDSILPQAIKTDTSSAQVSTPFLSAQAQTHNQALETINDTTQQQPPSSAELCTKETATYIPPTSEHNHNPGSVTLCPESSILWLSLRVGVLCNQAKIEQPNEDGSGAAIANHNHISVSSPDGCENDRELLNHSHVHDDLEAQLHQNDQNQQQQQQQQPPSPYHPMAECTEHVRCPQQSHHACEHLHGRAVGGNGIDRALMEWAQAKGAIQAVGQAFVVEAVMPFASTSKMSAVVVSSACGVKWADSALRTTPSEQNLQERQDGNGTGAERQDGNGTGAEGANLSDIAVEPIDRIRTDESRDGSSMAGEETSWYGGLVGGGGGRVGGGQRGNENEGAAEDLAASPKRVRVYTVLVKGAPEYLLPRCRYYLPTPASEPTPTASDDGASVSTLSQQQSSPQSSHRLIGTSPKLQPITEDGRLALFHKLEESAGQGERIIALAQYEMTEDDIRAMQPPTHNLPSSSKNAILNSIKNASRKPNQLSAGLDGAPASTPFGQSSSEYTASACAVPADVQGALHRAVTQAPPVFTVDPIPNFPLTGLTFVACVSVSDPPREGVRDAVMALRTAGLQIVMVTGDAPTTGRAIGCQVGLVSDIETPSILFSAWVRSTRAQRLTDIGRESKPSPSSNEENNISGDSIPLEVSSHQSDYCLVEAEAEAEEEKREKEQQIGDELSGSGNGRDHRETSDPKTLESSVISMIPLASTASSAFGHASLDGSCDYVVRTTSTLSEKPTCGLVVRGDNGAVKWNSQFAEGNHGLDSGKSMDSIDLQMHGSLVQQRSTRRQRQQQVENGTLSGLQLQTGVEQQQRRQEGGQVITEGSILVEGGDLDTITLDGWDFIFSHKEIVFARTTPSHKLQIVEEGQRRGHIVAVTGDGVNDSPALKKANIGIAMHSGSDVARDAAGLVLLNDDFPSIVHGVREGRLIFQNLRKVIAYQIAAGCYAEVIPVLATFFIGMPQPLSPFLMIIISCLTDVYAGVAITKELPEKDIMLETPRNPHKTWLVDPRIIVYSYLIVGNLESISAFFVYFLYMSERGPHGSLPLSDSSSSFPMGYRPLQLIGAWTWGADTGRLGQDQAAAARTGASVFFVTLAVCQFGHLIAIRRKTPYFCDAVLDRDNVGGNVWSRVLSELRASPPRLPILAAIFMSVITQVIVTEVPFIQRMCGTGHVPGRYWGVAVGMSCALFVLLELRKWVLLCCRSACTSLLLCEW